MQDGKLCQMGQDNRLKHCVTIDEAQKILRELQDKFTSDISQQILLLRRFQILVIRLGSCCSMMLQNM